MLFAGDVAMKAQPAFASPYSSIRQWLASLDRLEALKPAVVVPSHGPARRRGFITGYRTYLKEVLDRASAEKRAGRNPMRRWRRSRAAMVGSLSGSRPARRRDQGRLRGRAVINPAA